MISTNNIVMTPRQLDEMKSRIADYFVNPLISREAFELWKIQTREIATPILEQSTTAPSDPEKSDSPPIGP